MRVACVALCAASVCAVAAPLPHGDATHDRQWLYAETLSRGPKDWGVMLDAAGNVRYETCGTGTEQSPVNLASTTVNSALHALTPSYAAATELTVENTGSAIKVTPPHPADNHVVDPNLGGKKFEFSHITFHSPSEHRIGGGSYDVEMQLHHVAAATGQPDGADTTMKKLVSVVLFRTGLPNSQLTFFDDLPGLPDGITHHEYFKTPTTKFGYRRVAVSKTDFAYAALAPSARYFTYNGSDTTPPCEEGTRWYVYQDANTLSGAQVALLRTALGVDAELVAATAEGYKHQKYTTFGNNRPTQALNTRAVQTYAAAQNTRVVVECDDDTAWILGVIGTTVSTVALAMLIWLCVLVKRKPNQHAELESEPTGSPSHSQKRF